MENSGKLAEQVEGDVERQRAKLNRLRSDLSDVRKAADAAQGMCIHYSLSPLLIVLQRRNEQLPNVASP